MARLGRGACADGRGRRQAGERGENVLQTPLIKVGSSGLLCSVCRDVPSQAASGSLCYTPATARKHKLKSSQKDKVHQLMAFTQADERTAIHCLAQSECKLDTPRTASSRTRPRSTRTPREPPPSGRSWSRCITDPQDENKIGIDGIQKFCDDLSVDPASVTVVGIAGNSGPRLYVNLAKRNL